MGFFDKLGKIADSLTAKKAYGVVDSITNEAQSGTRGEGFDEKLKQAHSYVGQLVKQLIHDNPDAFSNHLGDRGTYFAAVAYFYASAVNEELGSGRWHSDYGILDEGKIGPQIATVVHAVLEVSALHKEVDREEAKDLLQKISYTINHTAPGGWLTSD